MVSRWKNLFAVLSLVLAGIIWLSGLVDSLNRPSVEPTLMLQQQELSLLAEPAVPDRLRTILLGSEPRQSLKKALEKSSDQRLSNRQKLLLALLKEPSLAELEAGSVDSDPLVKRLACEASLRDRCIDLSVASSAASRLIVSAILPVLTALFGTALLINKVWQILQQRNDHLPKLLGPALSLTDLALLVAGGFVLISAVVVPTLVIPLVKILTRGLESPRKEAVGVIINYCMMAFPSLLILNRQLDGLPKDNQPSGGWLQWGFRPVFQAFRSAFGGWLMVTPLVIASSWLLVKLFGNPGGSNPLLELVLESRDPLALALLGLTAVVLAPFFEEVIFRGTLLPILVGRLGRISGLLASALLFGMAHISIGELAPLMVLGMGLGLVRIGSGRLFPCVLMHGLWNAVTFVNLLVL